MHNETVVCDDTEDIICPLCGQNQSIPQESEWQDDSTFQKCVACGCEFYCTRVITPKYYSTEYVEDNNG